MKLSELLNEYINIEKNINNINIKINEKVSKEKELLNKEIEKKNNISNKILKYMNSNNLKDLSYLNNKFLQKKNKTYSSLSQKYIKNSIQDYFKDKKVSDDFFKYLLDNRDCTIKESLHII